MATPRLTFPARRPLRIPAAAQELFSAKNLSLAVGVSILTVIIAACLVVPWIASRSVDAIGTPFLPPSFHHLFGTDDVGRDVFVRTLAGARLDLLVALFGVGLSLTIGTAVGIVAGVSEAKWIDAILMRIVDALIAFPFIVLVLMLVVVIGPAKWGPVPAGIPAIFIAMVCTDWAWYARLARAQAATLRNRDYVVAAKLLGYSKPRIVVRHLVPSVVRVNCAYAVGDMILFMVATASLALLGAGVEPPVPEWGAIMFEGESYLQVAWWITIFPALVLALTGLALALIADSLLTRVQAR